MHRRLVSIFACALLVAACGGDDDSNNTSGNNGTENNTSQNNTSGNNTSGGNNTTGNNGTGNNGDVSTLWHAEFTDSDPALPDANGQNILVVHSESMSSITSQNLTTGANLAANFDSDLTVGELKPFAIKISWLVDPKYVCQGNDDLTFTFDSVEPTSGSFTGTMTCTLDSGEPFQATVTSTFSE